MREVWYAREVASVDSRTLSWPQGLSRDLESVPRYGVIVSLLEGWPDSDECRQARKVMARREAFPSLLAVSHFLCREGRAAEVEEFVCKRVIVVDSEPDARMFANRDVREALFRPIMR